MGLPPKEIGLPKNPISKPLLIKASTRTSPAVPAATPFGGWCGCCAGAGAFGGTPSSSSLASTVACSAWFHAAVHAAPFALRAAPYAAPCALCAVPDAVPCALSAVPDAVACRSAEWLPCRSVYWAAGPQHLIPLGPSERRPNLMRPVPTTKRPFDARSFGSHFVQSRPNLPI
jgi:hypothetical protein